MDISEDMVRSAITKKLTTEHREFHRKSTSGLEPVNVEDDRREFEFFQS